MICHTITGVANLFRLLSSRKSNSCKTSRQGMLTTYQRQMRVADGRKLTSHSHRGKLHPMQISRYGLEVAGCFHGLDFVSSCTNARTLPNIEFN
jgi:hypothetical protein